MDIGQIDSIGKPVARNDQLAATVVSPALTAKSVNVQTTNAVQQPDAATAQRQVGQALQSINKALQAHASNLEFSVDADSNRTIVKVIDQQTKEIIRQMPTEEAVEISKALDKLQGLLVRQKA